jgi:capsular polysaccharide biosynthesis protein
MPRASIFIFDSSYPSADVALPIGDAEPHVVVSDRNIEPPPGHTTLQLEKLASLASFGRNLQSLRGAWRKAGGEKCIVIAVSGMRREQLLLNTLYALSLCWNVMFFDGARFNSLMQSGLLILGSASRVLARIVLGGLRTKIKRARFNRSIRTRPDAATPEGRLFGLYTSAHSFGLPLDSLIHEPDRCSIYGDYTVGWYLPMLSNRRQRYSVQTTRHRLCDISLHVEDVNNSAVRFLFKDGRILDYPYLLGKARPNASYLVSTCREIKSVERGIDLLHYTSGYYHWLLEGVPRILDLIDDGVDFDKYPLILPPLEMFHREALEVLGISIDTQVVTVDKGDWCHVRHCIFPTANFPFAAPEIDDPSGQPDGALLRRIRERLLERLPKLTVESTSATKRLYISRRKATKRKFTIQTETAVRSILEAEGFQSVCLEDLPWAEQVLLVSSAEFIVGLHGAGLANILFAKAKSLIEFQNPFEARSYFASMARELDMNYAYIVGGLEGHAINFDNITIDPRMLTDMLHRLDDAQ